MIRSILSKKKFGQIMIRSILPKKSLEKSWFDQFCRKKFGQIIIRSILSKKSSEKSWFDQFCRKKVRTNNDSINFAEKKFGKIIIRSILSKKVRTNHDSITFCRKKCLRSPAAAGGLSGKRDTVNWKSFSYLKRCFYWSDLMETWRIPRQRSSSIFSWQSVCCND
jgi:hypothetical protein